MAKHVKGKFVSKGQRISCTPNQKATNLVRLRAGKEVFRVTVTKVANQYENAMRSAFTNAKVSAAIIGSPLVASVINAVGSKAGINNVGRGWQANVSRRSLVSLTKDGVFA